MGCEICGGSGWVAERSTFDPRQPGRRRSKQPAPQPTKWVRVACSGCRGKDIAQATQGGKLKSYYSYTNVISPQIWYPHLAGQHWCGVPGCPQCDPPATGAGEAQAELEQAEEEGQATGWEQTSLW